MQSLFSNALSSLLSQHLALSTSRRETLSWLVFLFLRQGSVCLWRLATHVESHATLASVQRRFYRFFQYCAYDYQKRLQKYALTPSMSGRGNCYDNASVETFFKTIKAELIWRQKTGQLADKLKLRSLATSTASTTHEDDTHIWAE